MSKKKKKIITEKKDKYFELTLNFTTPQIASAIKEVVSKAGGDLTPHILCGDFNSEVTSPGYQLCTEGYLSDACIQQLQSLENLQFQDGTVSRIKLYLSRKIMFFKYLVS